jgi:hypothetical protein
MGANPTQAVGIVLFLIAFTLLAGALADGGIIYAIGFLIVLVASIAMFLKCKPWEHKSDSGEVK